MAFLRVAFGAGKWVVAQGLSPVWLRNDEGIVKIGAIYLADVSRIMRVFPLVLPKRPALNRRWVSVFLLTVVLSGPARALSPEIEVDRLLLAAREHIAQNDFAGALGFLQRVEPLKVAPPTLFYYLQGKALVETGDLINARPALERYVETAGREGEFYSPALALLTRIETSSQQAQQEKQNEAVRQARAETTPAVAAEERKGDTYDRKVQSLYLGVPLTEALVTHINGLLRTYAYIEGKIKRTAQGEGQRYRVSVNPHGELLLTEKIPVKSAAGNPLFQINQQPLATAGVSPFVDYRCTKSADSCYLKNPSDGADWIRIANDETGAKELATALERLIRALQRG